jgi:hypothetical protein
LIDEDDVTLLSSPGGDPLARAGYHAGGAQSRAADEDEHGIGDGLRTKRGKDDDVKRDTSASLSSAIFEHDVLTAEHGVAGIRHGARQEPNR